MIESDDKYSGICKIKGLGYNVAKVVFLSILILLVPIAGSVQAKVYKFIDEHGQVHYSNRKSVKMKSKQLNINSVRSSQKIKLIPSKYLDKAVKEGKITEAIATRMRYFNNVSQEYLLLKKKKKGLKLAIASAKSGQSHLSAEQVKYLKQKYDIFIKEEYYYVKRNYQVSRKKIRALLAAHNEKTSRSSNKKQDAKLEWR